MSEADHVTDPFVPEPLSPGLAEQDQASPSSRASSQSSERTLG